MSKPKEGAKVQEPGNQEQAKKTQEKTNSLKSQDEAEDAGSADGRPLVKENWFERNSKPKPVRNIEPPPPTRFSSPGPIDWEEFKAWATQKALPKSCKTPKGLNRGKRVSINKLRKGLELLSRPMHVTPKYEFPKKEPIERPTCKGCFTCELDFAVPDFKVAPSALKYNASEHISQLAKPKTFTSQAEVPLRRRKMRRRQWKMHLQRLEYLAQPRRRQSPPDQLVYRPWMPLRELRPRIDKLARPMHVWRKEPEPGWVKRAALKAKASARITDLAKPSHPRAKYKWRKPEYVKKAALQYNATERLKELAKPKKYTVNVNKKNGRKKKKGGWGNYSGRKCRL